MDFVLVNPLLKAARSLNKMVALGDIAPELEELMRGGADNKVAMTERWAATAVELKSGEMVIVSPSASRSDGSTSRQSRHGFCPTHHPPVARKQE